MAVPQKPLCTLVRLCVRDTQSPVGNMYLQPETSLHSYGSFPSAVLSKAYSEVCQLKYETI